MRRRFRDYGFTPGQLQPGPWNSITDVPGVHVGHTTIIRDTDEGQAVRTGVTAILPHENSLYRFPVKAVSHVINGFGKTTGLVQVEELCEIESPIMLTNTFSVPAVTEGVLRHMMREHLEIGDTGPSLNVVVGECNDSYLNDMRGLHVRPEDAIHAIQNARRDGPVPEGAVGAGTGMVCFGWKGGIGTASRVVGFAGASFTIGVLVLSNFGRDEDLTVLGVPVGQSLNRQIENPLTTKADESATDGSIMMILATDLPATSDELRRFAKRAVFGLARTGSIAHHGSGDVVIAFSNYRARLTALGESTLTQTYKSDFAMDGESLSLCFRAVSEATEEAILNSLAAAETTTGKQGRVVRALPMEDVVRVIQSQRG